MKEFRILIDEETRRVTVIGSDGVERKFAGVVLFAGDGFTGESLIIAEGCSAGAAFAFVCGYGMPAMANFYKSAAFHFCKKLDPRALEREGNPEEILERWEKEDQEKAH